MYSIFGFTKKIASHRNTPIYILEEILEKKNFYTFVNLSSNPSLTEEMIKKIYNIVKKADPFDFEDLAVETTILHIIYHPNTPIDILKELSKSDINKFSSSAKETLHSRQKT